MGRARRPHATGPNRVVGFSNWAYTDEFAVGAWTIAALLLVAATLGPLVPTTRTRLARVRPAHGSSRCRSYSPRGKSSPLKPAGCRPRSSRAAGAVEVYVDDWPRLLGSAGNTLKLLALGFAYGVAVGFAVGVSIGWSRRIGYWVHPVLRVLGPVPATALLPLTFYFFPSSYSAAAFLIALATGFPVAVLTWSGVASVNKQYYDVARTLGANARFLVLRVAIPAALPHVFVGIFMGLSASFTVLVVAEMMGVKSGLGWYLSWAQGWASYVNMYAALIVMALLFSGLIALLFAVRDRVLAWQKGTVKW